ncbi:MAG: thioredoxin domain-containing protein [Candidatus Omnitrophota bacterium]|nr:thioredoxin domain-containing protein [Candidatus Omnitrophota bacterium]
MGEHKLKKKAFRFTGVRLPKPTMTLIIISISVIGIFAFNFSRRQRSPHANGTASRSQGNPQANVRIAEFMDFQCSHCAEGSKILKEYLRKYPGQIYLAMQYFPLGQLNSMLSAIYVECAARQGKFWAYQDLLLAQQDKWRTLLNVKNTLRDYAQQAGVQVVALDQCVQQKDVPEMILKEKKLGESYQITSTPTYFINNKMVVGPEELKEKLGMLFKEKQ